jgi:hypothetical protein
MRTCEAGGKQLDGLEPTSVPCLSRRRLRDQLRTLVDLPEIGARRGGRGASSWSGPIRSSVTRSISRLRAAGAAIR